MIPVPAGIRPLLDFAAILRPHGFAVSPDLTEDFIAAVGVLGPRGLADVRRAALAIFAIPPERRDEFDALFRAHFEGMTVAAEAQAGEDDELDALEATGREIELESTEGVDQAGREATVAERLGHRPVAVTRDDEALSRFARRASGDLPRRRSLRRTATRRPGSLDLRATLRRAVRREGEVFDLRFTRPRLRQRRIVLLIDVSGSMAERTPTALAFAHALVQVAERAEVFTLGTRLTRITTALRARERSRALARVSALVADIDGGTRIGDALNAFLAVPRFAGFARGALVTVLSDGLERGGSDAMTAATERLSRLAWRLHWLSPLAVEPVFVPQTEALMRAAPHIDVIADGSSLERIVTHMLSAARAA